MLTLFVKGIRWFGARHGFFAKKWVQGMIEGISALAFSILIAFLMPESEARRVMKLIGGCWLGILLYLSLAVLSADFLHFILKHITRVEKSAFSKRTCSGRSGLLYFRASVYGNGNRVSRNYPYDGI